MNCISKFSIVRYFKWLGYFFKNSPEELFEKANMVGCLGLALRDLDMDEEAIGRVATDPIELVTIHRRLAKTEGFLQRDKQLQSDIKSALFSFMIFARVTATEGGTNG